MRAPRLRALAVRKLSLRTSAIAVTTSAFMATGFTMHALNQRDPSAHPQAVMNAGECVRCHSDQKTIAMMREKESGTNYLFNSDGTFKDPKLASLTSNYRHTGPAAAAGTK